MNVGVALRVSVNVRVFENVDMSTMVVDKITGYNFVSYTKGIIRCDILYTKN